MIMDWISRVLGGVDPSLALSATQADEASLGSGSTASLIDSDQLAAELARARRYEHDLAVAVLWARPLHEAEVPTRFGHAWSGQNRLPQMLSLLVAVALRDVLRHCDIVCYHAAENRFVIGLPETGVDEAQEAFERIHDHFRDRLGIRITTGIAAFPDDALALDELAAAAETRATLGVAPSLSTNGNGHDLEVPSTSTVDGGMPSEKPGRLPS